jgi:hypothetical protein
MKQTQSNPLPTPATTSYVAYVGIDWADQKHDVGLFDPSTQQFEYSVIGGLQVNNIPVNSGEW